MKEYVFKYKLFTMPWWYEFKCYASSTDEAVSMFFRENYIGLEAYRIAMVNDI